MLEKTSETVILPPCLSLDYPGEDNAGFCVSGSLEFGINVFQQKVHITKTLEELERVHLAKLLAKFLP